MGKTDITHTITEVINQFITVKGRQMDRGCESVRWPAGPVGGGLLAPGTSGRRVPKQQCGQTHLFAVDRAQGLKGAWRGEPMLDGSWAESDLELQAILPADWEPGDGCAPGLWCCPQGR